MDQAANFHINEIFSVKGKNVLITGGSRGIGEMIARGFVENGANVYISSRKADACHALAEELSAVGKCVAMPADISQMHELEQMAIRLDEKVTQLDVLVNNAGATWGAPLHEFTEANWDKVIDLNLKSIFFLTQKLLPLLRNGASFDSPARVINISSVHGLITPKFETYSYSASKAGLIMLTRHLARRLASENILVNAIAPGTFATKMMATTLAEIGDEVLGETPIPRVGRPEEIAGLAIFLSSRASGYTTGAVIPCDGGLAEI